jgi:hypothetical protein
VDISAYTYLMAAGTLPENRESAGQSGLAAAWHHNAYRSRSARASNMI